MSEQPNEICCNNTSKACAVQGPCSIYMSNDHTGAEERSHKNSQAAWSEAGGMAFAKYMEQIEKRVEDAYEQGVHDATQRIIEWLRLERNGLLCHAVADAIERGEHEKGATDG